MSGKCLHACTVQTIPNVPMVITKLSSKNTLGLLGLFTLRMSCESISLTYGFNTSQQPTLSTVSLMAHAALLHTGLVDERNALVKVGMILVR